MKNILLVMGLWLAVVSGVWGEPKAAPMTGSRFIPNEFFGTTTHVNYAHQIVMLKDLNMRAVRTEWQWGPLEPARGQYNFSTDIFIIGSANDGVVSGLDQLANVTSNNSPAWGRNPNGTFPNDQSIEAFEQFAYTIATKYKGKIKYWEANNEPDMAVWKDRYVTMLKAFYRGIKRADPTNKVVLAGFAGVEDWQLDQAYKYGAKNYFDILNSHSYTRPLLPEEGGYLEKIKALRRVMQKYGDSKPIWVTEMGWNGVESSMLEYLRSKKNEYAAEYLCSEEDQARGIARLYLISATVPWIERVYFFHLLGENRYDDPVGGDGNMGVFGPWLKFSGRPKDAYFSLKTVIRMLNESTYQERIGMGQRIWALVFTRKAEAVIALWSLDDAVMLNLKDTSQIKAVTSWVGTPILVKNNKLQLSGRPIYLSVDPANLQAMKEQIRLSRPKGGKLLSLSVGMDMRKSTADQPVVELTIQNETNGDQPLPKILLRSDEPWKAGVRAIEDNVPLKAEEKRTFTVPFSGPKNVSGEMSFNVTAWLSDEATSVRADKTIRYAIIPPKPLHFKTDGDFKKWSGFSPNPIGQVPGQREMADWKGPADSSGFWYAGWDDEALYFAAEIKDDIHVQSCRPETATDLWREDCIQIGIDLGGDARPTSNVTNYDGVNDVEIGLGLMPGGPVAYTWVNPNGKVGVVPLKEISIVRDEKAKITRYETAIPWSVFGYKESPANRWMGMNVVVNDNDGSGRKGCLQWAPGLCYTKDPSLFPKVFFTTSKTFSQ